MNKEELQKIYTDIKKIQLTIDRLKQQEKDLENKRLLKMVDAELMDAIYNVELLLEIRK
ncbi:MAG: hypothetical protein JXL67_11880 [Calditrichaeota bacterium]|nr:hypothetical protein [Calditrichota bacterium]